MPRFDGGVPQIVGTGHPKPGDKGYKQWLEKLPHKRLVVLFCMHHGLIFQDDDRNKKCPQCFSVDTILLYDYHRDGPIQYRGDKPIYRWDGRFFSKYGTCDALHHYWIPYADGAWQYDTCPQCSEKYHEEINKNRGD